MARRDGINSDNRPNVHSNTRHYTGGPRLAPVRRHGGSVCDWRPPLSREAETCTGHVRPHKPAAQPGLASDSDQPAAQPTEPSLQPSVTGINDGVTSRVQLRVPAYTCDYEPRGSAGAHAWRRTTGLGARLHKIIMRLGQTLVIQVSSTAAHSCAPLVLASHYCELY